MVVLLRSLEVVGLVNNKVTIAILDPSLNQNNHFDGLEFNPSFLVVLPKTRMEPN